MAVWSVGDEDEGCGGESCEVGGEVGAGRIQGVESGCAAMVSSMLASPPDDLLSAL
jgi:hypothetical protein